MTLAALTNLNSRLIRMAVNPQTTEADALDGVFGGDLVSTQVVDEPVGSVGSWSTAEPFEYRQTIDWLRTNVFGGDLPEGMSTFVTAFARGWGEKVFEDSGGEEGGHWPTLDELLSDEEFQNGVMWLPYIQARLPATFTTDGDDPGTQLLARSDPLTGVTFTEIVIPPTPPLFEIIGGGEDYGQEVRRNEQGAIDMENGTVEGTQQVTLDAADRAKFGGASTATTGTPQTIQDLLKENPELKSVMNTDPTAGAMPHISAADLTSRLQGTRRVRRSGGSAGGTKRTIEFDRAHLLEQAEAQYEDWLLEPAPSSSIERIVDSYIRDARAFWSNKGGQLDFGTDMRNQLRALPRYRMMMRHKPEAMTEDEWIGQFRQPISSLGLRADTTMEQSVRAITSGGSAGEQLRRVSRTREAQQSRAFSSQLAQTVAGLGAGGRS